TSNFANKTNLMLNYEWMFHLPCDLECALTASAHSAWRDRPDEAGPPVRIPFTPPVSQQRTVSAIGQRAPFGRRARPGHCRAARHSADANAGAPAPSPYYFDEWE